MGNRARLHSLDGFHPDIIIAFRDGEWLDLAARNWGVRRMTSLLCINAMAPLGGEGLEQD